MSTQSRVDDFCSLGGFPFFGPGLLKARGSGYSLLIYEENRLCKAMVTPHASLPWLALPGKYYRWENSYSGDFLSVVGIETKTILLSQLRYEFIITTLYVYVYTRTFCQDTGVLFYHSLWRVKT